MESNVRRYASQEALSQEAAKALRELAVESVKERGIFTLALSGGKTPKRLYELLARPPLGDALPWGQIHVFWGDERCVAPDHPDSNYALAFQAFLSRVAIPQQNVHRIPGEMMPVELAVSAYESTLKDFFSTPERAGFDLILLGVGSDGHTASLFPGSEALDENRRWVAAVRAPDGLVHQDRITLTLPFINAARDAWFLVSGAEKTGVVDSILSSSDNAQAAYPAAKVHPRGALSWFVEGATQ